MVFGFFNAKKNFKKLKEDVNDSFGHVKNDVNKIGEWIKHLDAKKKNNTNEIINIKNELKTMYNEIKELKESISSLNNTTNKQLSKQEPHVINKQTNNTPVQTVVQTAVQTDKLDILTVMERAIVWSLLNADMKLSYEDMAALLGKDKSTIRGQINNIKQKIPGLVKEIREATGKKRLYINESIKKSIIKKVKAVKNA